MIKTPGSTELNSSTYTAITLGEGQFAYGFSIYAIDTAGDLSAFYIAVDSAGTGEALVPDIGLSWSGYQSIGRTVLYAKSLSGTPDLVLLPGSPE